MLISFRLKNFCSFEEEQTLLMSANSQPDERERYTFVTDTHKKERLLKTTAIYGANASGKTNFVGALYIMREIVLESARNNSDTPLSFDPSIFKNNEPTEFEVTFIQENIKYQYGFAYCKERILEEWLFAYPKGREQCWFQRIYQEKSQKYEWKIGNNLKKGTLLQQATRDNALFLSIGDQNNNSQLQKVYAWFSHKLKFMSMKGFDPEFSIEQCLEGKEESKQRILQWLKSADIGIKDIKIKTVNTEKLKESFEKEKEKDALIKHFFEQFVNEKKEIKQANFLHANENGQQAFLPLGKESNGTQKLFAFLGPMMDSFEKGNILVVDEIDAGLHPLLCERIIDYFHSSFNANNAQLIFNTHATSLLRKNIFRKDQIWFCEKQYSATKLYPLSDFFIRKETRDIEKLYLEGRFGAIPYLDMILEQFDGQ
ncbi:AAA family ATPase [Helicobacter cetorum]|uniref:RloA protein n=1 Tax=Helicobacter cetorum (strain ATCC BAA-429 / MIT 00-7128) TaxID=182217 RepID=I0EKQ7_HELC0|nr:ATP-binding protein [Helicobacter cetorum]AFI03526.1 RloA protein [Helicobacter cetorum MIT 00-7128]